MMAGGRADDFQVVMLATGTNAFLGAGCTGKGSLLFPREVGFELNHTSVRKKEGRILLRNKGGASDDGMPLCLKVSQKILPNFAAYGGAQSLHTNSFDEALCLPTQEAATLALRTQQIIAEESGAADTIDPLAGSYSVEAMTDKIEAEIDSYIKKIDALGGTLKAIEKGYIQREIQDSSYRFQKEIESNERVYVGINKYLSEEESPISILKVDQRQGEIEAEKLRVLRAQRDQASWKSYLENLERVSKTDENVLPAVLEAVKAGATVGEICDVWRRIFGEYRPKEFI